MLFEGLGLVGTGWDWLGLVGTDWDFCWDELGVLEVAVVAAGLGHGFANPALGDEALFQHLDIAFY